MAQDLDLISTPDLIHALLSRFDSAVVVGERVSKIPAEGIVLEWTGDLAAARGWSAFAGAILDDELRLMLPDEADEAEEAEELPDGGLSASD